MLALATSVSWESVSGRLAEFTRSLAICSPHTCTLPSIWPIEAAKTMVSPSPSSQVPP